MSQGLPEEDILCTLLVPTAKTHLQSYLALISTDLNIGKRKRGNLPRLAASILLVALYTALVRWQAFCEIPNSHIRRTWVAV